MRLYGEWKVTIPGEEFTFQPDEMTGPDCYMVEQELEGTPWEAFDAWILGISEDRWVPCQTLIWFLRTKAGQQVDRRSVDFPLRKMQMTKVPKDEPDTELSETNGSDPSPSSESDPDISTT